MRKFVPYLVGLFVFAFAIGVTFAIWAMADGIQPPRWSGAAFRIVSFPLSAIAPSETFDEYFWQLVFLNSLIWAAAAAFSASILLKRFRPA